MARMGSDLGPGRALHRRLQSFLSAAMAHPATTAVTLLRSSHRSRPWSPPTTAVTSGQFVWTLAGVIFACGPPLATLGYNFPIHDARGVGGRLTTTRLT
ncbi:MAG TPA: hypothetical protein VK875_11460 [Euzebyales bacterium]|nr:hypothetical protein [Euzebyales bacterium]